MERRLGREVAALGAQPRIECPETLTPLDASLGHGRVLEGAGADRDDGERDVEAGLEVQPGPVQVPAGRDDGEPRPALLRGEAGGEAGLPPGRGRIGDDAADAGLVAVAPEEDEVIRRVRRGDQLAPLDAHSVEGECDLDAREVPTEHHHRTGRQRCRRAPIARKDRVAHVHELRGDDSEGQEGEGEHAETEQRDDDEQDGSPGRPSRGVSLGHACLLALVGAEQEPGAVVLKRVIDVAVATVLLVVLSPVMLVVAMAVASDVGRPVIFRHTRPGRHGHPFVLAKFRTMRDAVDSEGRPLPDAQRLTRVGRLLRATSLDELPELWSVIRGDMSLVGPRPLLNEYLPYYTPEEARRHDVRPGITGWSQINGRNDLPWDDKLALDVHYVDNRSFLLDVRILLRTLAVPFHRAGISREGHATTPRLDEERRAGRSPGQDHQT